MHAIIAKKRKASHSTAYRSAAVATSEQGCEHPYIGKGWTAIDAHAYTVRRIY